jgi:glucosamine-6-phosphate deaminase
LKISIDYIEVDKKKTFFFLKVIILISGTLKAYALHMAIEEGINHMWTVSAFQNHPRFVCICDEDATMELKVKTVRYFKGLLSVHSQLIEDDGHPLLLHTEN